MVERTNPLNGWLKTGKDSFKCENCKDDFHEGCENLMIFTDGVYKCNCVCNNEVVIPQ